jgi:hypothetical protein
MRTQAQKVIEKNKSLIALFESKGFGVVDIEKQLSESDLKSFDGSYDNFHCQVEAFKKGFKKAQSLNDKKFSLEDVKKTIEMAQSDSFGDKIFDYNENKIIETLQQSKVFDIEVEIEDYKEVGYSAPYKMKPKVTNNQIKILNIWN